MAAFVVSLMSIKLSGVSTLHNLGQKEMQNISDAQVAVLFTAQISAVIEARFSMIEVPDVGTSTASHGVHLVAVVSAVPVELRGGCCVAHDAFHASTISTADASRSLVPRRTTRAS